MQFKIRYRTETGTDTWLCEARNREEAEDKFRNRFGFRYEINGIYKMVWAEA